MLQILPYYHAQNQTELTSSAMCLFDWFKICHRLSLKKKGSQSFKQSPQSQDQSQFFVFFVFWGGGMMEEFQIVLITCGASSNQTDLPHYKHE